MPGWWDGRRIRSSAPRATEKARPPACSSAAGGSLVLVHSSGHPRPALAHYPDDRPIDTGVQHAAAEVVGEEGVEVGQEGHGGERSAARRRARGRAVRVSRAHEHIGRRGAEAAAAGVEHMITLRRRPRVRQHPVVSGRRALGPGGQPRRARQRRGASASRSRARADPPPPAIEGYCAWHSGTISPPDRH